MPPPDVQITEHRQVFDIPVVRYEVTEHRTLRFVTDLRVSFTNNLGERAIRMPKVKQKISGCFRTIKGAEDFCIIRFCLDTEHKQGSNMFEFIRHSFMGNRLMLSCHDDCFITGYKRA